MPTSLSTVQGRHGGTGVPELTAPVTKQPVPSCNAHPSLQVTFGSAYFYEIISAILAPSFQTRLESSVYLSTVLYQPDSTPGAKFKAPELVTLRPALLPCTFLHAASCELLSPCCYRLSSPSRPCSHASFRHPRFVRGMLLDRVLAS